MAKKVVRKKTVSKTTAARLKKKTTKKVMTPRSKTPKKSSAPKRERANASARPQLVETQKHPVHTPPPSRSPQRRIIGPDKTITVVSLTPQVESSATPLAPTASAVASPPVQPKIEPILTAVAAPRVSWCELPSTYSAELRFLVSKAEKECESASPWPFPFAKFLASLPRELCATEFAVLIATLDREVDEAGRVCGMSSESTDHKVRTARARLMRSFAETCPEMERKWRGLSFPKAELLVEPHLVLKVDRYFQTMVADILIRANTDESVELKGELSSDRPEARA